MQKVKIWLRQNFDFNQREINGFLILVILMLLFLFLPILTKIYYPNRIENTAKDKQKLDSLIAIINQNSTVNSNFKPFYTKEFHTKTSFLLFAFNPNTESKNGLIKLGIKHYIAERMIKFRTKFRPFKVKSDVLKVYGFDSTLYKKLYSYILLPEKITFAETEKPIYAPKPAYIPKKIEKIDLNTADSAQFEKIYGIGAKLAIRILKYRNKLGGFVAMNQLKEVFGLDSIVLAEMDKKMFIQEQFLPTKIRINFVTVDDLKSHPYIGFKYAKVIIAYRNTHGGIKNSDDLKDIKILTDEEVQKINPYLLYE